MSANTTETATSLLAKEIARELAALLPREAAPDGPDPKGLRNVQPALLNIEQTAKYLGRTVKGVRDLEKKRVLSPIRFDRKVQFRRSDLDAAIDRHAG